MLKLLRFFKKKDWLFIALSVGLIVLQVWLDLKMPDYTASLTKEVSAGNVTMKVVWKNGGLMLACALGSMVSAFVCGYLIVKVANSMSLQIRQNIFSKIATFSSKEMKQFSIPSLITRTTNDVTQVQMFLSMGLQMLIKSPILAVWAIFKISNTSVEWTISTIVCVTVIIICVGCLVGLSLPKFKRIQKLIDNLNNATRESVSGVRVVRAFNAEDYQENKFEQANSELTNNQLFTSKVMGLMSPIMNICMNGLTLAIYWIGAYLVNSAPITEKAITVGNMTAFTQYALQVVMAFMMLIFIFIVLPRSLVASKRINEVLDTSPCIKYGNINSLNSEVKGKIEFKNVSFKYVDGNEDVLTNISFTANPGETVAFIGSTGSGKTSIINLIPRYYDVNSGEILIDNINIKNYSENCLHDKVAIVPQKAILFKGDIKSNITYGSNKAVQDDDKRIFKAIEIAQADFVNELEQGILSPVAQGGTNFSGGQKQRLSIARALFKDAEILIFDDSFSALDYKTDSLVRQQIKKNLKDKTIIIVAQRIGTIMDADKIIVLDNGQIVAQGTHNELMKNCSLYQEIALSQLSKEEL